MNAMMNSCHLGQRECLCVVLRNECSLSADQRKSMVRWVECLVLAVLSIKEPQVTQGEEEEELPTRPRRQTTALQLEFHHCATKTMFELFKKKFLNTMLCVTVLASC